MSREIGGDHLAMLQLGSMHPEERLAAFLLNLVHRLRARGFSESSVLLRMSREEIGSYLGLKLETVSRTFSKFQASGLLSVQHREIHITNPIGLQKVLAPSRADAGDVGARGQRPTRADRSKSMRIPGQVIDASEALPACFGVACACRSRCARYAAVDESHVDPQTLITCARGTSFPLFVDAVSLRAAQGCAQRR